MKWLIIAALLLVGSSVYAAEPTSKPARNVLLIIGDDQGLDGASFGNPACDTPNLDRLAKSGTNFKQGYATVSSCSPSRAVILTGLYTHTNGQYGLAHGQYNQHTLPWVQSLPRVLNKAGYRTALIGKNHVLPPEVYPYQQTIGTAEQSRNVKWVADEAAKIFSATDPAPFFVVIGFHDPHRAGKGFDNKRRFPGVEQKKYDPKNVTIPYFLPDDPKVREDLADYYQSLHRMDQGVGLVLDELKKADHDNDTLVIYASDNGMPFPGAKTTLYDAGVHLPFIIRVPGARARARPGVESQAMVSWIDIAPTVLDWTGAGAGAKVSYPLPGRSLLPIVDQPNPPGWDRVFGSYIFHEIWMYYPMRSVRNRQYKLIWNLAHTLEYPIASDIARSPSQHAVDSLHSMGQRSLDSYLYRPEFELYDIQKDPNELHNLADDPALADVKKDLHHQILQMMADTNDAWNPLVKNPLKSHPSAPKGE